MPRTPCSRIRSIELVRVDRLEARDETEAAMRSRGTSTAWAGHNTDKLWIRSEGERESGHTGRGGRARGAVGPQFQPAGGTSSRVRGTTFEPDPDEHHWAAFGVQGLAPYRLELEATAFLDGRRPRGHACKDALRLADHQSRCACRLCSRRTGIRAKRHRSVESAPGSPTAQLGLRVRYELRREIAPYLGLVRERSFGRTADLARAAGHDPDDTRLVAGVRLWF